MVVVLAAGWFVPLASAGARGDGPKPVKVGALFDQSGPTADIGTPYSEGVRDYVTWRNQSGDDPRPVDLLWADFGYKVPEAEPAPAPGGP